MKVLKRTVSEILNNSESSDKNFQTESKHWKPKEEKKNQIVQKNKTNSTKAQNLVLNETNQRRLPNLQSSQRTVLHEANKMSAEKHVKNTMKTRKNWPKTVSKKSYQYGMKNTVNLSKQRSH